MNKKITRWDVHLAVLKGLLHRVKPNWRKVAAEERKNENAVDIQFCIDGPVEALDLQLIQEVIDAIKSELGPECIVHEEIVRVDYPNPDYDNKAWVYARSEEPIGPTVPYRCNIPLIPSDEETDE